MPITSPASYIPTTEAFLSHWGAVDTALGAGAELIIPGGTIGEALPVTQAGLGTLYTALRAQHATVQGAVTELLLARGDLDIQKGAALVRLGQFIEKVRGNFAGSKWERALPSLPNRIESRQKIMDPLDAAAGLWTRVHAAGNLVVLLEGFTLANFESMLTTLRNAFRDLAMAEQGLRLEREERNDLQEKIHPVLRQYRVLMPTFFAPEHALVESLPRLTPEGGRTPAAVVAAGTWEAGSVQAKITWAASADPDLARYSIRWSPGEEYSTDDESVLGSVGPGEAREFFTAQGLGTPGATSLFRVYVVLDTENERGSETVSVTRPV